MLHELLNLLALEVSGQTSLDHVLTLTRHHRIQASPGYRAAAQECLRILAGSGVTAQIGTYPATGRKHEWSSLTPQEWDCGDAELWLLTADRTPVTASTTPAPTPLTPPPPAPTRSPGWAVR